MAGCCRDCSLLALEVLISKTEARNSKQIPIRSNFEVQNFRIRRAKIFDAPSSTLQDLGFKVLDFSLI
jgi:hypothetical protein